MMMRYFSHDFAFHQLNLNYPLKILFRIREESAFAVIHAAVDTRLDALQLTHSMVKPNAID